MTERKERTPGTWTVEKWPTKYPDLFTYNIVSHTDPATDQYHVNRYGVASGLDSEVDANLMAAAPELLEALQDMDLRCSQAQIASRIGRQSGQKQADFLRGEIERMQAVARAAIAKATGGEQ